MRQPRGISLIEVTIGAALFGVVILGGITTTHLSMHAVESSVSRTAALSNEGDLVEEIDQIFTPAGFSTLAYDPDREWTDPTYALLQPMPESVAADHVAFRRVIGADGHDLVYDPPAGTSPCTLYLARVSQSQEGTLVYHDGESARIVATHVFGLELVRRDSSLEATITLGRRANDGDVELYEIERMVRFRVP